MNFPVVYEKNEFGFGERGLDLISKLHESRIILLNGEIDSDLASLINAQLLHLDSKEKKDIFVYINSPGGCVISGISIVDTMEHLNSDVVTICVGHAMSMAAVVLACGTPGKRYSLPRSRVMIHEVSSGQWGKISDTRISHKETEYLNSEIMKILSEKTKKSVEDVTKDSERDLYMSAKEAIEYGLIDEIVIKKR